MPRERRRERVAALREVARSGIGMASVPFQWSGVMSRESGVGSQNPEVKSPTLSQTAREGWGTLLLGWGRIRCRGFGGYFGRRRDWGDLHRSQDFFQAVEDFVAVYVLGDAVFRRDGGHVQGELVARSILEDVEVLRVALASAFSGDCFGAVQFEVSNHQLGVRSIRQLRCARLLGDGSGLGRRGSSLRSRLR